jgi:CubicO group peptidase (beta-lactamase class C family)
MSLRLPPLARALLALAVLALVTPKAFAQSASPRPHGKRAVSAPGPRVAPTEIVRDLRAHIAQLDADSAFSGAVLVARNGTVLFRGAAGLADRTSRRPNRVDTKFNIGSMGKMFTAVAVLQLTQAGRLSLDDTLRKLLPDYPNPDVAGRITVRQLLTHTSGLGDLFDGEYLTSPREWTRTLAAHLPLFAGKPLQFAPGTKWGYSNAGYLVLGLVVERVSGQTFDEYLRAHVFRAAGMINTSNVAGDDTVRNMALGYTTRAGFGPPNPGRPLSTNSAILPARGSSAGGGYSTVGDLFRFAEALRGYRLLDSAYTAALLTGTVVEDSDAPEVKYTLGMEEMTVNGVRVVGHAGNFPGVSSILDLYPDQAYTVVVLSNVDNGVPPVNFRLRWVLRGQVDRLPRILPVAPAALQRFAGTYAPAPDSGAGPESAPAPPIRVTADARGLLLEMGPRTRRRFLPLGENLFTDRDLLTLRLSFSGDLTGAITRLTLAGGGPPIEAKRIP